LSFVVFALLAGDLIAQPANATIWDRVYTAEQAARGEDLYNRSCSYCHRSDLSGGDDGAPALRGNPFFLRWQDRSLSDFYFVLAETMPQDAPSSLSRKEYAEIISFILKRNDAAAGDSELVPDEERLKHIVFTAKLAP
jgi:mono/diheme cytochrome c family protein